MNRLFKSRKVILLVLILTGITFSVSLLSIFIVYNTSIKSTKIALEDITQGKKLLIESLYNDGFPKDSILRIIKESHQTIQSIGKTGEFEIAEMAGDSIHFICLKDLTGINPNHKIPERPGYADIMRIALHGKSGSVERKDYRNVMVLAGYTYSESLQWGIVAKIDSKEVNLPFQMALLMALLLALVFVFLGALLFIRITNPLIQGIVNSEEKFRKVFMTSPDAISISEIDDGKMVLVNKGYTQVFGFSEEEVIGRRSLELGIYADPAVGQVLLDQLNKGESVAHIEAGLRKKSGELIFGLISVSKLVLNERTVLLSITRDITLRRKAEADLTESEKRFKNLIWDMQVGVILQGPQAEIVMSNPKALELLGLTEDQLLGKTSFDPDWNVIREDGSDFPGSAHPVPQAIATGCPVQNVVMGVYRPISENRVWLLVDAIPQLSEDGTIKQVVCTFIDISDRKAAEHEINLQNKELHTLNAEKDMLFSVIAHDLRSPFNIFLGLTQIMSEESEGMTAGEIRNMASSMSKSAKNLYNLLENLLDWSLVQRKINNFTPEVFPLKPLITESLQSVLESAANKKVEINVAIPDDLVVFADHKMVESIVRNLTFNAIKFTPRGGIITVRAKAADLQSVEISIQDTGIGMSREMIDRLFRIDQQVSRRGTEGESSTGLGLVLCRDFVEKQGGKIWVQSEEGKGSVFCFSLPAIPDNRQPTTDN